MRRFMRKCGVPVPSVVHPFDARNADENNTTHLKELFKNGNLVPQKHLFLKEFSEKMKAEQKDLEANQEKRRPKPKHKNNRKTFRHFKKVAGYLLEDWLFLALLGTIMAVLSMAMDLAIETLQNWHVRVLAYANATTQGFGNIALTYFVWTAYAVALVFLSACFVHFVAPQAIGSGIPEMKTILRGVILKEYLTFRTLISKMVGLTLSLGSGMPIGKEGPFVHIASILANLLSYFVKTFHGIYANESRSSEMLAAACAVGVSSTFSAPVGGVLFSIEVTSVYFAVRNYWRGFFAAACSATLFRLFRVWLRNSEATVVAFYQTSFPQEAFFPEEIPAFAIVGVICGVLAAAFILVQRSMVLFLRRNKLAKSVFQKHWMIYPIAMSLLVASLTYPKGFGMFLAGEKKFAATAQDFFKNCTWTAKIPEEMFEVRQSVPKLSDDIGDRNHTNIHITNNNNGKNLSSDINNNNNQNDIIAKNVIDISKSNANYNKKDLIIQIENDLINENYVSMDKLKNGNDLISTVLNDFSDGSDGIEPGVRQRIRYNWASSLVCDSSILDTWQGPDKKYSIFVNLSCFLVTYFFLSALMSTLPIPSGIFGPSFILGAGVGRILGEMMAVWYPEGIRGLDEVQIYPGVYAVVGAAAFCGGVTRTISVAVIVFELTGQLLYILPVMIAVLIANAVCSYLQPSIYDSIIQLKHLPYLPDIPQTSSNFHGIRVEQFMTRGVRFLNKESTYQEAQDILNECPHLKAFPVVEHRGNMILIGSCSRAKLLRSLDEKVGPIARQIEANRRIQSAIQNIDRRFQTVDRKRADLASEIPVFASTFLKENEAKKTESGHLGITSHKPLQRTSNEQTVPVNHGEESCEKPKTNECREKAQMSKSSTAASGGTKKRFTIVSVSETENTQNNGESASAPADLHKILRRRGGISLGSESAEDPDLFSADFAENEQNAVQSAKLEAPKIESQNSAALSAFEMVRDRKRSLSAPDTRTQGEPNCSNAAANTSNHFEWLHRRKLSRPQELTEMANLSPTEPSVFDVHSTIGGMIRNLTRFSIGRLHKNSSQFDADYDLHGDERTVWESAQLSARVNFDAVGVDPAPFQLVEHSSLFKVHSLFSLLGLSRAYVTNCGRLVGVVALRDLRMAVERVQNGQLTSLATQLSSSLDAGEVAVSTMAMSGGLANGDGPLATNDELPIVAPSSTSEDEDYDNGSSDEGDADSSEEDDIRNDLLTPCPEVINRLGGGAHRKHVEDADKVDDSKRPTVALKDTLSLLVRGTLIANSDPCLANTSSIFAKNPPEIKSANCIGEKGHTPISFYCETENETDSDFETSKSSKPISSTSGDLAKVQSEKQRFPAIKITRASIDSVMTCDETQEKNSQPDSPNHARRSDDENDSKMFHEERRNASNGNISEMNTISSSNGLREKSDIVESAVGFRKIPSWLGSHAYDREERHVKIATSPFFCMVAADTPNSES